ncbi:HNH endonuclease [Georgenia sp. TF02-10]|uniref:HNH endonuclease n=1 Tax=Georgenia sp. TF02-10 TaxID=2917725 RepID=UPI001FA7BF21|nr:HNH endonuclease [Georgenia sp. TF02-10]UNX53481.1 HNH endonuclease [Georgenia sp. TF02-10]
MSATSELRERIPASLRREILDDVCAYCGHPFATEVDHVVPLSRGGTYDRDNLVAACKRCNAEKLDFTPEEWQTWRAERGAAWPPMSPWDAWARLDLTEAEKDAVLAAHADRSPAGAAVLDAMSAYATAAHAGLPTLAAEAALHAAVANLTGETS